MTQFKILAAIACATALSGCLTTSPTRPEPDRSLPPYADGILLGAPPGPEGFVDGLRWTAPQGGEIFCKGGAYPLIWRNGVEGRQVAFSLIRMDRWTVVPGAPKGEFENTRQITWTIPDDVQPGDYQMYITGADYPDWRYSQTFTIKDCDC